MPHQDDASFDPKTWGAAAPSAPARHDEATSFDVRSWGGAEAPPPPPPASQVEPQRRGVWLAAGGAGVAILAVGGALALWSGHEGANAPAAAPSVAAAAPAPDASGVPASRRTLNVAGPGAIVGSLVAAGVPQAEAASAAQQALAKLGSAPGDIRLELELRESGAAATLLALEATRADGGGVAVTRAADGSFAAQAIAAKLETRVRIVRGEMDGDSFYTSAVAAGVTDSLISDFANAFSFDFNFATDLKAGDIFEAAFAQAYNPSGEPVGIPKLLYVSLSTAAKSRALYRFQAPGEDAGWYDGNGASTVRALMMTPVDGARISSKFGPRFHPVLHYLKVHKGTDFAAPTGTPIFASGDATVVWAAMKGANGNLTILKHDNGWQTYYLHQSMFMPGIAPGVRVRQGQKIGEIGTTGRSTGPHLHYEVHIDGQPVDPMSIPTGGASKALAGAALAAFDRERDRIDRARAGG